MQTLGSVHTCCKGCMQKERMCNKERGKSRLGDIKPGSRISETFFRENLCLDSSADINHGVRARRNSETILG